MGGGAGTDPFGAGAGDPFGGAGASDPFGAMAGPPAAVPSNIGEASADPFGATPGPDPFGATPGPDPFAGSPGTDPFGAAGVPYGSAPDPFGGPPATGPADPFGGPPASSPAAPFGASAPAAADPFGASAPAAADPFGGSAPADPFGASTFGTPSGGAPDPFGAAAPPSAPDPFTTSAAAPFGGAPADRFGTASGPSDPFGAAPAGSADPFGTAASPFGGAPAAPFGGSAPDPFATSAAPDPFATSAAPADPFGGGHQGGGAPDPFATSGAPSSPDPFATSASPFGAAPAPFGTPAAADPFATQGAGDPFGATGADPFGIPESGGADPFAASTPGGAWDDPFGAAPQSAGGDPFGKASFNQPDGVDKQAAAPIVPLATATDLGAQSTFRVSTGGAADPGPAGGGSDDPDAHLFELDVQGQGAGRDTAANKGAVPGARRRARRRSGRKRKNKRRTRLMVLGGAVVAGGLALSFTDLGPFGINAIMGDADTGSQLSTTDPGKKKTKPVVKKVAHFTLDGPQALTKRIAKLSAAQKKRPTDSGLKAELAAALLHLKDRHPSVFHSTPSNNVNAKKLLSPAVLKVDPRIAVLDLLTRGKKAEALAELTKLQKDRKTLSGDDHYLMGRVLLANGKTAEARESLNKAVATDGTIQPAHYDLAVAELSLGNTEKARTHLQAVLKADKGHAQATLQLGALALKEGKKEEARKLITDGLGKAKAAKSREAQFEAHRLLGDLNKLEGRQQEHIASLKRALEVLPRKADTAVELAALLTKQGNAPEALQFLERCDKAGCRSAPFLRALVQSYLTNQRSETAKVTLAKALKLHPKATGLRMLDAQFQLDQKRVNTAKGTYNAITVDDPKYGPAFLALAKLQSEDDKSQLAIGTLKRGVNTVKDKVPLLEALAGLYSASDLTLMAKETMAEVLRIAPERTKVRLRFAQLLNKKLNKPKDALPYYKQLDKLGALEVNDRVELADVLFRLGNLPEARVIIDDVLGKSREHLEANIIMGGILTSEKKYLEADQALRNALRIYRESARAYYYLGLNEKAEAKTLVGVEARTKLKGAAEHLQKAVELDPDNLELRYDLAVVLGGIGGVESRAAAAQQYSYIVKRYEKFTSPIEKKSIRPDVYLNRGRIYIQTAKYEAAIADFNAAGVLDPQRNDVIVELADALQRTKRFKEASVLLNTVLEREPEHAGAHYVLGEVAIHNDDRAGAERHFVKSVNAAHEAYPYAHRFLGHIYKDRGLRRQACNYFGHFVRLMPVGDPHRSAALTIMKRQLKCPKK